MIAFGAQRAIYNAEKGDLDDVVQNLELLRSNPTEIFARENWGRINPVQVLGVDFVREVNDIVPNIVKIRQAQQLLRLHAQTRTTLKKSGYFGTFLEHLNRTGLFFDAKFKPIEQSYLQGMK